MSRVRETIAEQSGAPTPSKLAHAIKTYLRERYAGLSERARARALKEDLAVIGVHCSEASTYEWVRGRCPSRSDIMLSILMIYPVLNKRIRALYPQETLARINQDAERKRAEALKRLDEIKAELRALEGDD